MKRLIAVAALFVGVAASAAEAQRCPGDNNNDGATMIDEIVASVNSFLNGCGGGVRFAANGDGTISDHHTGLMWEKKVDFDDKSVFCSSSVQCPDPHDADNRYTWSAGDPYGPTGTAYTVFLAQLNGSCDGNNSVPCTTDRDCGRIGNGLCGLGGHRDWRLPTREELVGIVNYAETISPVIDGAFDSACNSSCTRSTCSCTVDDYYLSSSTVAIGPGYAWVVTFYTGIVDALVKTNTYYARAVRTGL